MTLKLLLVIIPAVKKAWLYSRSETDQSIILVHITEDNCKIFLKFEKKCRPLLSYLPKERVLYDIRLQNSHRKTIS